MTNFFISCLVLNVITFCSKAEIYDNDETIYFLAGYFECLVKCVDIRKHKSWLTFWRFQIVSQLKLSSKQWN
ncbi:hypothetical protein C1141_07200 [Vibrio agarivorans]|nr:hypothetical protein C1141_07200 [Vibrio agarivorans]